MTSPSTALQYSFTPSVSPILVTATGANANSMDLQVMISNPGTSPLNFSKITIQIPVGEDTAHSLSSSLSLPGPAQTVSGNWKIAVSASTITLTSAIAGATSATVSVAPILFTLSGIVLPTTPGTVPITVTEFPVAGTKTMDDTTHFLTKLPNNVKVSNFRADPSFLSDVCTPTLYWDCSDTGSDYTYNLSSNGGWSSGGHSVADGESGNGVPTERTGQAITYTLDILQTSSTGSDTIVASLTLQVPSHIPTITNADMEPLLGGNLVILRWLATGADHCTLELDGEVYAENLPVDTYTYGYPVPLPGSATGSGNAKHQLGLTAYSASGVASTPCPFIEVTANAPVITEAQAMAQYASALITPDNQTVMFKGGDGACYAAHLSDDPPSFQKTVASGILPAYGSAFLPDGTAVLFPARTDGGNVLRILTIAGGGATDIPFGDIGPSGTAIAVTQLGGNPVALVAAQSNNINILARFDLTEKKPLASSPTAPIPILSVIAVTPDNSLAIVVDPPGNIIFYDIVKNQFLPGVIPPNPTGGSMGSLGPGSIAITPDGATAVIAPASGGTCISVIDIASRRRKALVAVGQSPCAVCIVPGSINVPGGTVAVIAHGDSWNMAGCFISFLDIINCVTLKGQIKLPGIPFALVLSSDGKTAVVPMNGPAASGPGYFPVSIFTSSSSDNS